MNKYFLRIWSILLALALCLSGSLTTFAAEEEHETKLSESYAPASTPTILNSGVSNAFQTQEIFYVTLNNSTFNASFYVAVRTNSSANYSVKIVAPNGQTLTGTAMGDANLHYIGYLAYAPAGEYKFSISRKTGTATTVTALGAICK